MLKMIQVVKYMLSQGLNMGEICTELNEIIDNHNSQYFELTEAEIMRLSDVFHNEAAFDRACMVAQGLTEKVG